MASQGQRLRKWESRVRVLSSAYGSRGDVEPLVGGRPDLGLIDDQALVGRVAAVGQHGGSGTTTAALVGPPHVVVPRVGDRSYGAGRVADLGIGTAHDGPAPTTESRSAGLGTALTPESRARAGAVAGTIRTGGATGAATSPVDAANRERPPVSG
jgi:vancomycin aglycone glucosyltransferase